MAAISTTTEMTAEQLAELPSGEHRYELVEGALNTMTPAGNEHGRIAASLSWRVASFVDEKKLGAVYAAETGFLLSRNPDSVRAPDFAFIRQQRIDEAGTVSGFWPGAPDLVAEVVSPNDSFADVEAKSFAWLAAGCRVVWVVEPRQQHVTVYRSSDDITVMGTDEALTEPELRPGLSVNVKDLFPK